MTATKHSPGPWVTDDVDKNDRFRCVINGNKDGPVYIARLPLKSAFGVHTDAYRAQEANARLMAAAPDLLEALQAILAAASVRIDDPRIALWDTARAAIAKATGVKK